MLAKLKELRRIVRRARSQAKTVRELENELKRMEEILDGLIEAGKRHGGRKGGGRKPKAVELIKKYGPTAAALLKLAKDLWDSYGGGG